jgi:hypothetical protein
MLETPHAVIGAVIATKVVNPLLAIPLAFLSHFPLEEVPHWNPHLNTEKRTYGHITAKSRNIIIGDVVLSLVLGGFIAYRALPNYSLSITILLSSLAAVLPDLMEGPYFFLNQKSEFITKWIKFQKSLQADTTVVPGLLTQVITIIAAFMWLLN